MKALDRPQVQVLAALSPNSVTSFDDAASLAEALVNGDGHFEASARDLLTALFLLEQRRDERASIQATAARQTRFLLEPQQVNDEDH